MILHTFRVHFKKVAYYVVLFLAELRHNHLDHNVNIAIIFIRVVITTISLFSLVESAISTASMLCDYCCCLLLLLLLLLLRMLRLLAGAAASTASGNETPAAVSRILQDWVLLQPLLRLQ